ncbi:nitroreductase family deazaflavin-dependent oxidoreductase [Saccharopolyspora taberi]|uniref:Nitroreductase family deazaflavin-dependent oxidoreductase n=1 Tax=Saccharopolyspora taberi TaxID=60895 RepID=A0ABN3VDW9_9PSEU
MNPLSKLAQSLGKQEWFASVGKKLVPADLAVQERTGGRVSLLRMVGLPYLVLTATGRRSGRPRSVPLLYAPHGEDFVVVGSNWGQKNHPAWSANLLAHPEAEVQARGRRTSVRARLVTGAERDRLWREVITPTWPAYDSYAARAGDREIRVFVLSRRA